MMPLRQPDATKVSGDSFRRQQEVWRRAYAEATSLRERFPKVEELVLEMVFNDLKAMGTYSPQLRSLSASAKAFFAIPCPRTLCLDGGFDLDSVVRNMLACDGTSGGGTLECQGWVDPTRAEHTRCLLKMDYRLEVRYEARRRGGQRSVRV